jgi:flavin reductase (DIM6/NTAB) family NADH-FMN oxidoreductase RutF
MENNEARTLRTALGHFATGISVVSTRKDEDIACMTVNSFTSVSLVPPLILLCINNHCGFAQTVHHTQQFAVDVLSSEQKEIALICAGSDQNKKSDLYMASRPHESDTLPRLSDCLARFDCALYATFPGGDHYILVGEVKHFTYTKQDLMPLVFYRSEFQGLAPHPRKPL